MGISINRLIASAIAEWNFFGNSTRSIDDLWNIAGDEAVNPYRDRISKYWKVVGFPDWNGNTSEPWSGAFISWCFSDAGIAGQFDATHSVYVDRIRRHYNMPSRLDLVPPMQERLQPGDLIWNVRGEDYQHLNFDSAIQLLSQGVFFPSHVDIIVAASDSSCDSIGGNVSNRELGGSVTRSTWHLRNGFMNDSRKKWIGVVKNRIIN